MTAELQSDLQLKTKSMDVSENVLLMKGINKAYGSKNVLSDINLSVRRNELIGLIGPNGAGKTTLLEIAEGVNEPSSGVVSVFGVAPNNLPADKKRRIGLVFQRYALPGYITVRHVISVFENMLDSLESDSDLIVRLGLSHLLNHKIGSLSAGQQQRLAVYLALLGDRSFFLLDEPTSALDLRSRKAVWETLIARKRKGTLSGLLATHNMGEAALLCDSLCFLRDGAIYEQGPVSQFLGRDREKNVSVKFNAPPEFIASWRLSSDSGSELVDRENHYELTCARSLVPRVLEELLEAEIRMDFNANFSLSERDLEKTYMEIFSGHA